MSTTAPDYLATLRDGFTGAMQQWVDQSTSAWDQWSQAWSPAVAAAGRAIPAAPGAGPAHHHLGEHRHDDEGCHGACGCSDACDCCVPEADVVVRARAGEVRVVPFRLHNPWRREREVSLELGPWHVCSGQDELDIRGALEEDKVVLKPCEDRIVRLRVSTRTSTDGPSNTTDTKVAKDRGTPVESVETSRTGDVWSCVSAYADVRFEGCARPQRVALVVLPADCDAVEVGCGCGCCCEGEGRDDRHEQRRR